MKSGIPWSVKGIEPDVREAAKDAARRSGLTLGEWLNAAIIERAETAPVQPSRFIHPRVRERLDSITDELAMMTAERPAGTHGRYVESLAPQKEVRIDYDAVIDRIENGERYVSEALASVNDRLQSLKQQIVELTGATSRVSDDESYMALEAALRNIVGHLEVSERRTHEALKSVEDQVAVLARRRACGAKVFTGTRLKDASSRRKARSPSLPASSMRSHEIAAGQIRMRFSNPWPSSPTASNGCIEPRTQRRSVPAMEPSPRRKANSASSRSKYDHWP